MCMPINYIYIYISIYIYMHDLEKCIRKGLYK